MQKASRETGLLRSSESVVNASPLRRMSLRRYSSNSSQPPISRQRLTIPQNSSAVFSVS